MSPTPRTPLALGTLILTALLLVITCGTPPEGSRPSPALADFVFHQRLNLTTDLISVPESIGLELIDYGWRIGSAATVQQDHAEISEDVGRVQIFSADGDLAGLEIELGLSHDPGPEGLPLNVKLNHQRLARLLLQEAWTIYRLDVPADLVRTGLNLLELRPRTRGLEEVPVVRLRRLRLQTRNGRALWPQRPAEIRLEPATSENADRAVEMPTASYLDMVFRVPEGARLVGSFSLEYAIEEDQKQVEVYARLLDRPGAEHQIFHQRYERPVRRRPLSVDLKPWTGRWVRTRLGISGPANALLRWHQVGIQSAERAGESVPRLPIDLVSPDSSGRLGKPDILVILLDAARADAFSPWGAPHPTPAVERLAADGTVFDEARSPAPWTGQSVPAIFTGLYPDTLGVGAWGSRLPEEVPTLAELMQAAGYRTVLWSQHPFYRNHTGFRRGFEEFYRSPQGVFEALPDATHLLSDDRPTFAFVHLIPPHAPYTPPAPFLGAYSSWYTGDMQVSAGYLNSFPSRSDPEILSDDDLRYARDRYLENVAFADDLVDRVLSLLEHRNRYEETLVVLLSDHGEAFLEHDRFLHTRYVHRELLHVPFVIKWPASINGFRARVRRPVSLVDLLPTLADGLSLGSGAVKSQGRSLLPSIFEGQSLDRAIWAVTRGVADRSRTPKPELLLETDGWRILYDPLNDESKLYRTETDPLEAEDLASREPMRALALRQQVLMQSTWNWQFLGRGGSEEEVDELDADMVEQLRALGYLN